MYHTKLLISLINFKTIILLALTYIIVKCIISHYSRNPRWVKFSNKLPGPPAYPIIGTAASLLIGGRAGLGPLLVNYMNTYGPVFRLWIGQHLAVVISDVNDVEAFLTNSNGMERNLTIKPFEIMVRGSLVATTPVAAWRQRRKAYQPFFIKNNVLHRIPKAHKLHDKLIEKMKKHVDGPEFNLEDYMNDISFDTILNTHFSYEISDEERKQFNICHRITEALERLTFNWLFGFFSLPAIVQWLKPVDIGESRRIIFNFIDKVLDTNQTLANWSVEKKVMKTETINEETFTQSFFNKLFELRKEFHDADLIHSEVLLLLIAGSETTGTTMASCFLALAAHPEIQEKVYQEMYQVFGDDERLADISDLEKLPYLKQVIRETQRYFTIFPIIVRDIERDMKIGAHFYPAGITILVNAAGIHHNPKIYPHPYRFNPENFAPEAIKTRHRYSFLAFSAGPKNCIGKEYAEITMKLRLISLLRIFTFHTNVKLEDLKLQGGVVERSSIGYPVSIKLRKKIS